MPTSQDKNEFQSFLLKTARGVPPEKMMYFHRYLMEYGEKDAMPLLEKDLVFYLEVQRFKVFENNIQIIQLAWYTKMD